MKSRIHRIAIVTTLVLLAVSAGGNSPAKAARSQEAHPAPPGASDWLALGGNLSKEIKATEGKERTASATSTGVSQGDLAQAAQNPIANMISVPFQNNFNFGVGPDSKYQNLLNIQPVIPVTLNDDWNMITRTIIPIVSNPAMGSNIGSQSGMGDIQFSAFFSPSNSKKVVWGVGPVFLFPSATDDSLGTGKFSVGPTAVLVAMDGPWVVGALVQNLWSFAGDSNRGHVNQFLVQPFINYNLPDGWYLSTAPSITANWAADRSSDRWTVPVGGGFGKVFKIGKLPINASLRGYYNVCKPTNGPDWTLQLQIQFLFPK